MPSTVIDHRLVERFPLALVDATLREHLPSHWEQFVIAPAFLGGDTGRCPALVNLAGLPGEEIGPWCDLVQAQVMDRAETQASLLLASDQPANKVAAHLARRIAINVAGLSQPMQWRFFDPGTFLQLPHLLGDTGLAWLLGPINAVCVPWAGEWTLIEQPAKTAQTASSRFRLEQSHLAALTRVGVTNRVLMQSEPAADVSTWIRHSRQLDACVVQGQAHGLTKRDDLVAYALHALQWHPRIHQHQRLQAALRQLRQASADDELDYRELTALITPEEWGQMALDVNTEAPRQNNKTQEDFHP